MSDSPIKLRPVIAGDSYSQEVEGGYMRKKVPGDGLIVQTEQQEFFLPENKLVEALRKLDGRRGPRARPRRAKQLPLDSSKRSAG